MAAAPGPDSANMVEAGVGAAGVAAAPESGKSAGLPCGALSDPAAEAAGASPGLDLDAWRGDLQRLHGTIDQVVQSFISSQTRQLDVVAVELASQKERIVLKEQHFAELSDSIAGFVEEEARRMEACGLALSDDPEADARIEAYDAGLPGPPALHRINRLWRKATRAFESARAANEMEAGAALEAQRREFEAQLADSDERRRALQAAHEAELAGLRATLEASDGAGERRAEEVSSLSSELSGLAGQLEAARAEAARKAEELEQAEALRSRCQYEWEAERDELCSKHGAAAGRNGELEQAVADAGGREAELAKTCKEQAGKLEQMRKLMDDQERELNQKIERVQQYVKERQTGALHAEKKQQDAERMAERWQSEVRRLQGEKDRLAKLVLDMEGSKSGQATEFHGVLEKHQQEVSSLREALRRKEDEMRAANGEMLQQRDEEYQAKVSQEKQREKDRSIALLRKKEQEVHIKEQQLKAARQRIQELESGFPAGGAGTGGGFSLPSAQSASPAGSSRGSTATGRRENSLPPLPLSAR